MLFVGDLAVFVVALYVTLAIRYLGIPKTDLFLQHLVPFAILFLVWTLVFFIAGLYERRILILKNRLVQAIAKVQITNSLIGILFFYFVPFQYFGITPKINLLLYMLISIVLVLFWRVYFYSFFSIRNKEKAILIGSGNEFKDLKEAINGDNHSNLEFVYFIDSEILQSIDFNEEIVKKIYSENITTIVADLDNEKMGPILPHLYNLVFSKVRFIDLHKVYESVFEQISLSLVRYNWFLENVSFSSPKPAFDFLKRFFDILLSMVFGIISLVFYPLIIFVIYITDGRPVFFIQERVGKDNQIIKITKFRTMTKDGKKVTSVGKILRKIRIDELPQLWNVFSGSMSLVGPRPEIPELVKEYKKEISYYEIRHILKPGLSGWAQIHQDNPPKFAVALSETKTKFSYDLYYIKNRSLLLDLKIALRTIAILLSRTGI